MPVRWSGTKTGSVKPANGTGTTKPPKPPKPPKK